MAIVRHVQPLLDPSLRLKLTASQAVGLDLQVGTPVIRS